MARSNTGSTSNYFANSAAPVTAVPLTMVCWFNPANVTADMNLVSIIDTNGFNYFSLSAYGAATSDRIAADTGNGTTFPFAQSSAAYTANSWHHAAGVWTSATSRAAFLNGANKGTNSTSCTPGGLNHVNIAAYQGASSGVLGPLNGSVAEAAIWNVALSDAEIARLAEGVSPLEIRPESIVAYWSLDGLDSPEPDWKPVSGTRYPLTMTGTMAFANHAPVNRFSQQWSRAAQYPDILTSTYTGSGSLAVGTVTTAGTGAHTAPVYTGSGSLAVDTVTVAGTGTETAPQFTGSGSLAVGTVTADGDGTHTDPPYTGSGTPAVGNVTCSGTGTASDPVYSGSGALAVGEITASGTGTETAPQFTGSGSLAVGNVVAAGEGTASPPFYSGSGSLTVDEVTAAGSGEFAALLFEGSGALAVGEVTAAGSGIAAEYQGAGTPTIGDVTCSGSGTFTNPVYTGSGEMAVGQVTVAGQGLVTYPGGDVIYDNRIVLGLGLGLPF